MKKRTRKEPEPEPERIIKTKPSSSVFCVSDLFIPIELQSSFRIRIRIRGNESRTEQWRKRDEGRIHPIKEILPRSRLPTSPSLVSIWLGTSLLACRFDHKWNEHSRPLPLCVRLPLPLLARPWSSSQTHQWTQRLDCLSLVYRSLESKWGKEKKNPFYFSIPVARLLLSKRRPTKGWNHTNQQWAATRTTVRQAAAQVVQMTGSIVGQTSIASFFCSLGVRKKKRAVNLVHFWSKRECVFGREEVLLQSKYPSNEWKPASWPFCYTLAPPLYFSFCPF